MAAARMAIAYLKEAATGQPPKKKLPPDNRQSCRQRSNASRLISFPRWFWQTENMPENIEVRVWGASLPVIHLASAIAVLVDICERDAITFSIADLLVQRDLIEWIVRIAEVTGFNWKERGFDDSVINSSSSTTGLMQLTKGAVQDVDNNSPNEVHYEYSEMTDAAKNIECGSYYLQILFGRWGSVTDARNHFGTGPGYADNILTCETCLKTTPEKWSNYLLGIHPLIVTASRTT